MRMQETSRGYPLSNPKITQRYADQMVVVSKMEGQASKKKK